ncbi:MAG: hypothetical protein U5K69_00125 [Balneolaceae bacterium]|nr:hypothetical protein [Balneolaceae bacterium]
MNDDRPAQLLVQVKTEDGDPDEIDRLTRQLLLELREEDVESAELAREDNLPPGAKSVEAVTLGAIVMAVLPNAIPKIIELVQSWIERGTGRNVVFKGQINGENVEFEGSSKDFKIFLESLKKSDSK